MKGLSARLGYQEEDYNPWGRGAGNPNRDSAGMCRGIGRGVYVPTDIHAVRQLFPNIVKVYVNS